MSPSLSFDSPRFSFRAAAFTDIEHAIGQVGHVVLDDVWNPGFLTKLRDFAENGFGVSEVGATHFTGRMPDWYDQEFFVEVERSGLPALLRHLLSGDFVINQDERIIRRADATFVAQFSGLHQDGQLRGCSDKGINSRREFTIWTPLQDCTGDDTPRLLLLHRGHGFKDVFLDGDRVRDGGIDYLPVQLRPVLDADGLDRAAHLLDQMFDRLYAAKQCYAPRLPIGSAVLFEHDIVHGSYRHSGMMLPRFSLDFRVVGVYRLNRRNARYNGVAFRSGIFPDDSPVHHPHIFLKRRGALVARALRGDQNSKRALFSGLRKGLRRLFLQ